MSTVVVDICYTPWQAAVAAPVCLVASATGTALFSLLQPLRQSRLGMETAFLAVKRVSRVTAEGICGPPPGRSAAVGSNDKQLFRLNVPLKGHTFSKAIYSGTLRQFM